MATLHLLDMVEKDSAEYIVFVDLFHAFDTPPKELLVECLQRAGIPPRIVLLITSVLFLGETRIKSSHLQPFRTTHGTKQVCPFSPLLFVLFFDSVLRTLKAKGVHGPAFMDDLAFPCRGSQISTFLTLVQQVVADHGMKLNASKCEILPLFHNQPVSVLLPKECPPSGLQPNNLQCKYQGANTFCCKSITSGAPPMQ